MKHLSSYGIKDFIILCGYKSEAIKKYFSDYLLLNSDLTFNFSDNQTIIHKKRSEDWNVTLLDTGLQTMTGGRLLRAKEFLKDEESFLFTYGDGVGDVKIKDLVTAAKKNNCLATVTAAYPPGRFGALNISESNQVTHFNEKPKGDGSYVNAGYFILKPEAINYVDGDHISWESEPLEKLAKDNELYAYKHNGFWQPMDTLRDMNYLNSLWSAGKATWKTWQ